MKRYIFTFMLVLTTLLFCSSSLSVSASDTDNKKGLTEIIEDTINGDKETLGKLSPSLEKAFDKLINAFKTLGTMSKDVSKVVNMFNALDPSAQTYEKDLEEFFNEYNNLSPVKRKLVDAVTGLLGMKDSLVNSLKNTIVIDLYSTKKIDVISNGRDWVFHSGNETIATIDDKGVITPVSLGFTAITAEAGEGESQETVYYRVFVKKPILSSSVKVKRGNTAKISLPSNITVNEIHASSKKKISFVREGYSVEVKGLKQGTAYLYVGTQDGTTLKYKIKIK